MAMSSGGNKSKRSSMSDINVTPLVDVMLVLLIMFMVTVPMMQQGIEVNLPETAAAGVETTEDPLTLTISSSGKLVLGEAQLEIAGLRDKLIAIFKSRQNKQIYLKADRAVDYGTVAEVMGEIRAAGIFNIGLITLPKNK